MTPLKSITIRTKLLGGFGAVALLGAIIALTALYNISIFINDVDDILGRRMPQVEGVGSIIAAIYSSSLHIDEAILAGDMETTLKELEVTGKNRAAVNELMDNLKKSVATEKGKDLYQAIVDKREPYIKVRDRLIALLKEGRKEEALREHESLKPLRDGYLAALKDMDAHVQEQAAIQGEHTRSKSRTERTVIIVLAIIATVISVSIALWNIRSITRPLHLAVDTANKIARGDLTGEIDVASKDETGQMLTAMKTMSENLKRVIFDIRQASASVASGSSQLSSSSEEITRTMDDQSNRSSQIATSAEEMSQTVIDIAKNASDIAQSSSETAGIARKGAEVVNKSVDEARTIAETVNTSARVMQSLGEKSKQIGEIVSAINDIADQTNLLALNAAIEAARAGEQGRGFAVVADEVRKLAERTAKATSEISQMIGAIQSEVDNAVDAMNHTNEKVTVGLQYSVEAGKQLTAIVQSVTSLQNMVQEIASATEEMSSTSESISGDIQAVASGAKEISGGASNIAQSSSELARLAGQLKSIIERFKV
jgi:methyl-accepting chemotaxis protein